MDRLHVDRAAMNTPSSSSATTPTSRPPSRRTSTIIPRESLPTPPPDPRETLTRNSQIENVFIYPPTKKDLPVEFHGLLNYTERQEEFQRMLNRTIANDCQNLHRTGTNTVSNERKDSRDEDKQRQHQCQCCDRIRKECEESIEPLQYRLTSTITAALAAYGAIEQLNRMYGIWDQYLAMDREMCQRKECLRYVKTLERKCEDPKPMEKHYAETTLSDHEIDHQDMEQSIALLETILKPEQTGHHQQHHHHHQSQPKLQEMKLQRERSKSFMIEDMSSMRGERDASKSNAGHLLRRQSTYSDSKSKVSKWTKVKAAFKWERANVPAFIECSRDGIGLTPNNTEVARYLRVPSLPCGTSSADSILSSSSGHLLSDAGTPGTISSASSMDDIENACIMRRDSSKSDILETPAERSSSQPQLQESKSPDSLNTTTTLPSEFNSSGIASKSSSNKSIRKCKLVPDFEVLPEDVEAVIPPGSKRINRTPPSPLNLNLSQDLNDSDHQYYTSPQLLKASPQDGTQSLNRTLRKISSPVNSSVPSSPSRHSDFFAEFECEEVSSGDFSEPNSPNHLSSRKSYELQQDEINRRYQILRTKLDKEFENKRKEWQKLKSNRAMALVTAPRPPEPLSPNPSAISSNLSAKLLEENLTPDFKKKLQKWRVKKQASIVGIHPVAPMSPTIPKDPNTKIDWHLWKTGQLKLEGQGLTPLPDQKDLPEDFQKKLEQWNKIKRGGSSTSCTDSLKRTYKHGGSGKKGESDDDRGGDKDKRIDKHKPHDKEKYERLAKLKAIVSEHPAKEIEVKTSAGVMKFEGISRKFTRKLYEWEKARGIGPESSTFALLHPGYCPIDVKRISKESHNHENSPTLSRSLSLDSISPSIALPVISQQASSLSLNDVNELKEMEGVVSSTDALALDSDYNKKYDEPEAVMVEVEDHIVETASPLKLMHPLDKKQTPIYKYEEKACKDFCNSRKIQSFESHTNVAPLLNVLKNSEELLKLMKQKSCDIAENETLHLCDGVLALIRSSYSYYADNLMKPNVLNAISDVQNELSRLRNLCEKSPLDEACCQEIMEERNLEYNEEIQGLHETLEILKQNIQGGYPRFSKDIVPDINIITDDGYQQPSSITPNEKRFDTLSTTLEATDELSTSMVENENKPKTFSNSNGIGGLPGGAMAGGNISFGGGGGAKKKVRLRKMGSRQNSKTESDSSDQDNHSLLETPRRLKRKNYRLKQRSFDEDPSSATIAEDMVYVLKVKPGQPIQQICDTAATTIDSGVPSNNTFARLPLATSTSLPNVFVKTKRKVFTTVQQPMAKDGLAIIEQEILHSPTELIKQTNKETPENCEKDKTSSLTNSQKESLIRNLEIELKPRVLLVHKSISLDDVCSDNNSDDLRKTRSAQSLKETIDSKAATSSKGFRTPLATDSFRLLNRPRDIPLKLDNITRFQNMLQYPKTKKDHLYRKNNEKSFSVNPVHFKGATIKRIENKIAKTQSGSSVADTDFSKFLSPDKLDNTVPRIARKWDRKSLTPTSQQIKFDYPTPTNSEPTSPVFEQTCRPMTPLNERALRIQKAKEEFLRDKPSPIAVVKLRQNFRRDENWGEKRQSDLSLSSTTADECSAHCELAESEDNVLHKSLSADTIRAESPPTQSDTGTDQDFGGIYDSISRQVTRSGKISSKLGFATLASKLRRVKGKKAKDPNTSLASTNSNTASGSALSALCRQSLFTDLIVAPQIISTDTEPKVSTSRDSVMKSQSSPHALQRSPNTASGDLSRFNNERLNKSQSDQYVKRHKESYV
ncbi:uncharacterized protein LOC135963522 [Calliphora vicina]|uniref:uncharacterized protein LOC135963522 n=1 Tax=Calliphora vicina TaxID=7373 RepID=UPI00325AEADC